MTGDRTSAREALRALRERYRAGSGTIVERFVSLAEDLSRSPESAEVIELVRREAHRIHGTAGTYGFDEASRLAADLERQCGIWSREPATDSGERAQIVQRFAQALAAAFAAPASGSEPPGR